MPLNINLPVNHVDSDTGHTAGHNATNTAVNQVGAVVDTLSASGFQRFPKLRRWHAALGKRSAAPAQIMCKGDSLTEGFGTTAITRRWQTVLQNNLRARHGVAGGAVFPFIPGYPANAGYTGFPVTRSGTVGSNDDFGFGARVATVANGSTVTFTFTGTRAKVMFAKGFVAGAFTVAVDGGSATSVAATQGTVEGGALYDTGTLTRAAHTILITGAGGGNSSYIEGLLTFDGDENAGIRVLDAGHYGIGSGSDMAAMEAASLVAAGNAGLLILCQVTNDPAFGTAAASTKTNLAAQVAAYRTGGFAGSVLYVAPPKRGSISDSTWAPYVTALRELAAADSDGEFLDLGDYLSHPQASEPNAASLGLYVDEVHFSDAGNGAVADILTAVISR